MTTHDGPQTATDAPWWASGRTPDDGIDGQDPFAAHRQARGLAGDPSDPTSQPGSERGPERDTGAADDEGGDTAQLAADAIDLVMRLASHASRRVAARGAANAAGDPTGAFTRPDGVTDPAAPHPDGQVCQACPVCLVLRAVRAARPEVIGHLSDAAHHLALALQAFADAHTGADPDLTKIDLDP